MIMSETAHLAQAPTRLTYVAYNAHEIKALSTDTWSEAESLVNDQQTLWVQITGLADKPKIQNIVSHFGLHPLLLDDALNPDGGQKLDDWDGGIFLVLRVLLPSGEKNDEIREHHLAVYASARGLITFVEEPTPLFDGVIHRLRDTSCRWRPLGVEGLLWAVLDVIFDRYLDVIDILDTKLQALDESFLDGIDEVEVRDLFRYRREVNHLQRVIRPARDLASELAHSSSPIVTEALRPFLRDLQDHAIHALDQSNDLRELAHQLRDFYLTQQNNRMNEIMKVLACVSTIFLPLTFLAGVYGMNFDHLPEKSWRYGYGLFWAICLLIGGLMIYFFRRKKWL
jgi:magnesium transporter